MKRGVESVKCGVDFSLISCSRSVCIKRMDCVLKGFNQAVELPLTYLSSK